MSCQTRPIWDFEDIGDYWKRANDKNIAPIIMLKLKAIGVAAGMEKKLKEFNMAPKKATKDTKNR